MMSTESIEKDINSSAASDATIENVHQRQLPVAVAKPVYESWEDILMAATPVCDGSVWTDVDVMLKSNNLSTFVPSLSIASKTSCLVQLLGIVLPTYHSRATALLNIVTESNKFEDRIKELEEKTNSLQRDRIQLSHQLSESEIRHNRELSRLRSLTDELCETCEYHKKSAHENASAAQKDKKALQTLKTQQTDRLNRGRELYERIVRKSDFSIKGKVKGGGKRDTSTTDLVEYCEAIINRDELEKSLLYEPQKIIDACDFLSSHVEKALLPEECCPVARDVLSSALSIPTPAEVWNCVAVLLKSIAATLPALQCFLTGICRQISDFRTSVSLLLALPLDLNKEITPTTAVPLMRNWTTMVEKVRALNDHRNATKK